MHVNKKVEKINDYKKKVEDIEPIRCQLTLLQNHQEMKIISYSPVFCVNKVLRNPMQSLILLFLFLNR